MDRDAQIEAIVDFVNRHPESLATRSIRRRVAADDLRPPEKNARALLEERLQAVDEETLAGFYYLVK